MSKTPIKLDPSKGFVAIPAQILEIPMTAGAKAVLIDLCNLADDEGKAWPSLQYLADRIKRAKGSISSYLKELRELGLIETVRRKMPSGYDYKLEFLVTFWAEWISIRSRKAVKPVRKTERSMQQAERPTTSINKTQNTHTTPPQGAGECQVREIYSEWSDCTRGAPYGQYSRPVTGSLIERTEAVLSGFDLDQRDVVSADTNDLLKHLWQSLKVDISQKTLGEQSSTIATKQMCSSAFHSLLDDIRATWKPFWKQPPTPLQFEKMISDAKAKHPDEAMKKIIFMHYVSWRKAQKGLHKAA